MVLIHFRYPLVFLPPLLLVLSCTGSSPENTTLWEPGVDQLVCGQKHNGSGGGNDGGPGGAVVVEMELYIVQSDE